MGFLTTLHWSLFNPCNAKFISGNIKVYLHFLSFLDTKMAQVTEILPCVRQGPVYPTYKIQWLLMTWAIQGARASAAMVLTLLFCSIITVSAQRGNILKPELYIAIVQRI